MNVRQVRAAALGAACLLSSVYAGTAHAADGEPTQVPEALINPDYWRKGEARAFVSSRLEAGLVYGKPQVAVGYGQPYWMWAGVEAYAISTNSFAGGYVGVKGALPFVSLSLGAQETYSYYRSFLPIKQHYTAEDVDSPNGDRALYLALEAEMSSVLPVPGGYAVFAPALYSIHGAPSDRYVYEESLRGIMKPPWMWAARFAYVLAIGEAEFLKAGVLFEIVGLPGRNETILRAGPVLSVTLTDHLDVIGAFSPVLSSPDSLGIWHGPFGQLGLRYYFASGEKRPRFP